MSIRHIISYYLERVTHIRYSLTATVIKCFSNVSSKTEVYHLKCPHKLTCSFLQGRK